MTAPAMFSMEWVLAASGQKKATSPAQAKVERLTAEWRRLCAIADAAEKAADAAYSAMVDAEEAEEAGCTYCGKTNEGDDGHCCADAAADHDEKENGPRDPSDTWALPFAENR